MPAPTSIPRPALVLGLAGTLPFLFAALGPVDAQTALQLSQSYGLVILCFMAGTHWGFAARAAVWWGYALSVLPALAAFFLLTDHAMAPIAIGAVARHWILTALFAALLPIDALLQRSALAPPWWLRLRLMISAVVLAALILIGLGQTP